MMKRYIMTVASVLLTMTTFAQNLLVVEMDEYEDKLLYTKQAEVTFWGQPQGEEQNGDLTLNVTNVTGTSVEFEVKVNQWELFICGFYISEQAGQWDERNVASVDALANDHPIVLWGGCNCYEIFSQPEANECAIRLARLAPNTTYYIKPYAKPRYGGGVVFGSEKTFTTQWTIDALAAQETFGDWYAQTDFSNTNGVFILPTAEAWQKLCNKYKKFFGDTPSEAIKQSLTNEWFRHLTPAETDMMKAHSVAYYDNCEGGDVYVVDKVCDEMIPNMLRASKGDVDVLHPNIELSLTGKPLYTNNCTVESVTCDASYGLEKNIYAKVAPSTRSVNPTVGYNLPFALLPNCLYDVTVTIAPNTEDNGNALPNRFMIWAYKKNASNGTRLNNPDTSGKHGEDTYFEYGGKQAETFTFQIDTHQEDFVGCEVLQFQSFITSKQTAEYDRTMRFAKITVSTALEDIQPGDVDMDGKLDKDDVETVASAVVLDSGKNADEKSTIDFTGDGKTLIDDIVALVNFIQTGAFQPVQSKARVGSAEPAPAFTTDQPLNVVAGESTTLNVDMSGMESYTALSFDINVPEGVYIATDENGKPKVALGGIASTKHEVTTATQAGGRTISVVCFASDNTCFTKDAGTVITVDLTADYNTVPFDYAVISFANGMVTKPNLSSSLIEKYYITTGIANGIEDIREAGNSDADSIVTYYTIDGIQVSTPRKGFNIVKYSNGQKKKIFVK